MKRLLITWLLFFVFITHVESELKFVQAIWRHGDRAPSKLPYPLDTNDESAWPDGWGQLTQIGVDQMKELGYFFRTRYDQSLLEKEYTSTKISVQSSVSKRALDSAKAFLENFCLTETLKITSYCPSIAHKAKSEKNDPPTSFECPAYDQKMERLNSQLIHNLTEKYKDLIEFLGLKTGYGPNNISLHQVANLNDLNREIAHNLPQPSWIYEKWSQYDYKTTLELVTDIKRLERVNEFNKPVLAKLRGGYLLADWLHNAKQVANRNQHNPSKMLLYSSHDGTLQSLSYAMGIADNQQVPYAAAIIMEVHEHENGHFYVQLMYRRDEKLELKKLSNCEMECEVNKFVSLLSPNSIDNLKLLQKECDIGGTGTSNQTDASKNSGGNTGSHLKPFHHFLSLLSLIVEVLVMAVLLL